MPFDELLRGIKGYSISTSEFLIYTFEDQKCIVGTSSELLKQRFDLNEKFHPINFDFNELSYRNSQSKIMNRYGNINILIQL